MRTIILSSLLAIMGTGLAHANLVLSPDEDVTGTSGNTVGWGFVISPDPLEWASAVSSETLFETNPTLGSYTDFIGNEGGPVNGVIAPETPWSQKFDVFSGEGIGSFAINPNAAVGAVDTGTIEVLFETFSSDPNVCSTCATGFQTVDVPFDVAVSQPGAQAPEPRTFFLVGGGLLLMVSRRYRSRRLRS
jgi:hypothetical protein